MPLSKETKERIRRDMEAASKARYVGEARNFEYIDFEDGYIAGAEAEAERAKILIETLNSIKAIGYPDKRVDYLIETTLDQYNNSK